MENELLTKTQLEAWNNSFKVSSLKEENAELRKQIRELKEMLCDNTYERRLEERIKMLISILNEKL
jgi:hypothetical protein